MGWDADAARFDDAGRLTGYAVCESDPDPSAVALFAEATREAVAEAAGAPVDWWLPSGGLDLSANVARLAEVDGSGRGVSFWEPGRVRRVFAAGGLPPSAPPSRDDRERGSVASVRAFLSACVRGGYGIWFD